MMYPIISDQEIEVKFCLLHPEDLISKLEEVGANLIQPRTYEHNLRFDTLKLDLTRNHKVLRLRKDHRTRLTFKGPDEKLQRISRRNEIEFGVDNFESAKKLLEALGYKVNVIYNKYRITYTLDTVIITIDEMPYGHFAEVEGSKSEDIQKAAEKLGLAWNTRLAESYLLLFERAKKSLGLTFRDLTFENFEGIEVSLDLLGVTPADN